ncbi:calcium/calmodulin-dependent protein kinase type 1 [Aphelenchoides avenae]|nr:calcium/calmodulin-dependent protein kinase type 1 [Aphelenchus avenae]
MLQHGDTGAHNMFFKKNPDGSAASETSAFIDWQIAFKGNQFFDIVRAVYGFADAEVRREVEETIVDDYFKLLTSEMAIRGRSLDFGLTSLREGYALAAVHQACFAVVIPGIFDVKKDEFAPEVFDAWRHKFLLRANLALTDAIKILQNYAPQYLAEGQ